MSKEEINAFLGAATAYSGRLTFQGAVRVDGVFSGEIESDGMLIVGKDARVEGQLKVGELVLSGYFSGEARVAHRLTLHKSGVLAGSLHTRALSVEEGGTIEGEVHMRNGEEMEQQT
jgi:cytoskeletal protein CcmA (bactofilin family)